jgi:hypothetical protein
MAKRGSLTPAVVILAKTVTFLIIRVDLDGNTIRSSHEAQVTRPSDS